MSALEKLLLMDTVQLEVLEFILPQPGEFRKADAQIEGTSGKQRHEGDLRNMNVSGELRLPMEVRGRACTSDGTFDRSKNN